MGSSMLQNHTSKDVKFDHPFRNVCHYDGCRIDMRYTNPNKAQVLNDNRYCSIDCLKKQYSSLGFSGALHIIHQTFGPEHPVTKTIQRLRDHHRILHKVLDPQLRVKRGQKWEDKNFRKLCHMTEKCL